MNPDLQLCGILFTRHKRHPKPPKGKIGRAPRRYSFFIKCQMHLHMPYFCILYTKGLLAMDIFHGAQRESCYS